MRLCCWLDTKRRMNTMTSLRNSRPSVTYMESPDADSALPVDRIPATPRSGQQKTFCGFLDALKLSHPVLAEHPFGGQDLLTIGAQHRALVAGLVFLDSGR